MPLFSRDADSAREFRMRLYCRFHSGWEKIEKRSSPDSLTRGKKDSVMGGEQCVAISISSDDGKVVDRRKGASAHEQLSRRL